jgi:flagellar hook-associated protein 2
MSTIRMTGLASGLDTESIISALMSAQSLKKTKLEKAKTKLEWKQTMWSDLNTKLKNLYSNQVSKLQLSTTYKTKKTSVSDSTKANVTASTSAINGSYELEIDSIAKAQYLTGDKISATSTSDKLTDLGVAANQEIEVSVGDTKTWITVTSDMTIADFTSKLKDAGLNASYDTSQQRFFISSKDSGTANAFTITTSALSNEELTARTNLKDAVGYDSMDSTNKAIVDSAMTTLRTAEVDSDDYKTALDNIAKASYDSKNSIADNGATTYMKAKLYAQNYETMKSEAESSLKSDYYDDSGEVKEELKTEYETAYDELSDEEKENLKDSTLSDGTAVDSKENYVKWCAETAYTEAIASKADSDTISKINEELETDDIKNQIDAISSTGLTADQIRSDITAAGGTEAVDKALSLYYASGDETDPVSISDFAGTSSYSRSLETLTSQIESSVNAYASVSDRNTGTTGSELDALGIGNIGYVTEYDASGNEVQTLKAGKGTLVASQDSVIKLNGAELTSSGTTVSVNGLSIELTGLTKGEAITFSVATDVDAIYKSIKSALSEYNSVIKEMYDDYTADATNDYEPLTSDEKEAMSDDEIELWESKIKGSLLRSDTTLNSVMTAMKNAMQTQVEYNGKKYSLASFGIMTSTDYTEGGQYHIYGDEDDSTYASETDKLKTALEEDPDTVVSVLSGVFSKLRSVMSDKMAGNKVSSAQTFYNDIKLKSDISDYEDQISDWEDKLADLEDSYYDKFSSMETALAELQSQQTTLSNLFGS